MRAKILNASAGSGKTFRLAYKYVSDVVQQPSSYRNILAVTFTNKATEEMKSRILSELHALAQGRQSTYLEMLRHDLQLSDEVITAQAKRAEEMILHDYSRFTVLTIDRFFQRILRAFIKELGLEMNYSLELDTAPVLVKSANELLENIEADSALKRWLSEYVQERVDEGKKWDIREGILALRGEIFKEGNRSAIENAVSKEAMREIVERAVKHSAAAKKQLRDKGIEAVKVMRDMGVENSDFTSSFTVCFDRIAAGNNSDIPPTSRQKADSAPEKWFRKGEATAAGFAAVTKLQPLLRQIITIMDSSREVWNNEEILRRNYRSFAMLTDLYNKAMEICTEENTMLLTQTKYILSKFVTDSDAPFIYEKVGNRFSRFMIDEFQDTSQKEWENFLPLLRNAMAESTEQSVLLVGDVKQSIYRWRGGDWNILQNIAPEALGRGNVEIEPLRENRRSLRGIVEFNNAAMAGVVKHTDDMLNELLDTAAAEGQIGGEVAASLRGTLRSAYSNLEQKPCRKAATDGYISVTTYTEEPPVVEHFCRILDAGFRPSEVMILVRTKDEGSRAANALLAFKQTCTDERYQFEIMTQDSLQLSSSPAVSFIIAILRLTLTDSDKVSIAIYNRFTGNDFLHALSDDERKFLHSIRTYSPEEAFDKIVIRYGSLLEPNIAYLQALHDCIQNFCTARIADIELFLRWWDDSGYKTSLSVEASDDAVEIITIHKAKGLEKKVVLIPYCNWSIEPKTNAGSNDGSYIWAAAASTSPIADIGTFPVPINKNMQKSAFSEGYYRERVYAGVDAVNLLYVALTRAKEQLHIMVQQSTNEKSVKNNNIGTLLLSSLPKTELSNDEHGNRLYEYGIFAAPCAEQHDNTVQTANVTLRNYHTSQAQLQLRMPLQRFAEANTGIDLTPRNRGILLHKAFAEAVTIEDIDTAINAMLTSGDIDIAESTRLHDDIRKAMLNPAVAEWFGGKWDSVRNENDILLPAGASPRRPDRVMMRGKRAVVVDYKFGDRQTESHHKQVGEYMQLLREMGYEQTEGYLWYVTLGQTVKV